MRVFADESVEADFHGNGYVLLDLLSRPDVDQLAEIHRQYPPPGPSRGFVASMLLNDRDYRRTIDARLRSILQGPVLSVLNDYRLIHCTFTIKMPARPGDDGAVDLHQDPTFVDERNHASVTIWCPLIDVGPENGGLFVVRGSHRYNRCLRTNSSLPYPELLDLLLTRYATSLPMKAGQVLLMHPGTFHGSPPNASDRTRVAAGGVAVPLGCPLIYCYRRPGTGEQQDKMEIYDVDDEFYLSHLVGTRPVAARLLGVTRYQFEPLDPDRLEVLSRDRPA